MAAWNEQRDYWLRSLYPETNNRTIAKVMGCSYSAIKNRAQTLGLKKSPAYLERERPGCFRPGQTSWNKGVSYQPGGRVAENQFRPGHKPQTTVPVGTETVDKDGYLKRKVRDDAPPGMSRKNWKFVHVMKWEEYHGRPVPLKHIVRLKDGDKQNFSPDNLVLVSMAENAILNKFFAMENPPEGSFDVLHNLARIKLAANKRKRELTC
ncbi:HNH endonuclease signature motif containing protein [Marinobacter subterrani]|uniref:HNH endonuclease n=1 Tax=Marinobacter subterrani TaxID=1658765 RepID=A0A0J7JBS7_9GAMM|nr:HNH endonuclease signature motif containing protein [Marinobacter subterrani]KMQ75266.1 HNH endonuclease [Marinobacter subterrani]